MSVGGITIPDLLKAVYDDLTAWADGESLSLKVAKDPWHALYLLDSAGNGTVLILHWVGDGEFGNNINCPLARHQFEVVLARFNGPDPEPGKTMLEDATGAESLLALLESLRERLLSYAPPQGALSRVRYKSCAPVIAPSNMPFSAYRLTVEIDAGIKPFPVRFNDR